MTIKQTRDPLYDTGSSLLTYAPVTGDIRANHIWFLRHNPGASYGDTNLLGVFDPEDIKSVSIKQTIIDLIRTRKSGRFPESN